MKKKYEKPQMKTVELNRRTPLLGGSPGWDPDYTAGFNHEPGGQDNFE